MEKKEKRAKSSKLSGSSAERVSGSGGVPGPQALNPYIGVDEVRAAWNFDREKEGRSPEKGLRGSGNDLNSDPVRLKDPENRLDKMEEDSFPASDPPSTSPITGFGKPSESQ